MQWTPALREFTTVARYRYRDEGALTPQREPAATVPFARWPGYPMRRWSTSRWPPKSLLLSSSEDGGMRGSGECSGRHVRSSTAQPAARRNPMWKRPVSMDGVDWGMPVPNRITASTIVAEAPMAIP